MQKKNKKTGFTLVELMFVIGIAAILAGATISGLLGYRSRQRLDSATQQLAASIRDAQNRSVTQQDGLPWGIYLNNTTTDSYTVFSGTSYAASASTTRILTTLDAPLSFTTPASGNAIEEDFAQLSGLPSASAFVTITDGTNSDTISIASSGAVTY